MSDEAYSTSHLDYLQRTDISLTALSAGKSLTGAPPAMRRLWHIKGVGRAEKPETIIREQRIASSRERRVRLPSEDVLIGLYGYKIPLTCLIWGEPSGVAIHLGTWSPNRLRDVSAKTLDSRQEILSAVLSSLYPAIEVAHAEVELTRPSLSGLVLGIPTAKPADPLDGALPFDRLIRALSGANWACLVLSEPVDESIIGALRHDVINEMRKVQAAVQAERAPSPLAEQYLDLLKVSLTTLTYELSIGAWRTGVYLLGDHESYHRLSSVWRGIFSGDESVPEPVRVWNSADAGTLAVNWAMPETPGAPGPGSYQRPLEYQTLLTSAQLAAYFHLPQLETSGFTVHIVPSFDAVPPPTKGNKVVRLGEVIVRKRRTQTSYAISLQDLTRHAFVAGVTGAGKTNTIFHIIKQAAALGVPFLVVEPAKTEYRALLSDTGLGDKVQIFTLGNENVSPFRLNPFEVPAGTQVGVHLDLLRSVFSVSFGMWTPLPQVLEQCLHKIYEERGWDLTTDTNRRLARETDVAMAFPTLTDLVTKVEEVTRQLGYDDKLTADIRAALRTRINSLRTGGKGRMLDVQNSLPMKGLLEAPAIFELEGIGDDDDKAFVMGLLFIRLVEHQRAECANQKAFGLRHLLVIEEAHRLLTSAGPRGREEEANPRSKAVEAFANLLSEIRAYGQGIIVADQVPVKLAPDVIKNTNLKIAHRVVAQDDRTVLAGAMAMNEQQARALSTLGVGEAAVFAEGDDAPLVIKVEAQGDQARPDNKRVKEHMASSKTLKLYGALLQPLSAYVDAPTPTASFAREAARAVIDNPSFKRDFARFVLSVTEDEIALNRLWPDLLARARVALQRDTDQLLMLRWLMIYASEWFAGCRGRQAGWFYRETVELQDKLRELLFIKLEGKDWGQALISFRTCMHRLHARSFEPYPGCEKICTQGALCMYRHAVAELVEEAREELIADWNDAYIDDKSMGEGLVKTWEVCQEKAYQLIEPHPAYAQTRRRVALCCAQHLLAHRLPETHKTILEELLNEADLAGGREKSHG
jgi:Helicase HerA, central domain